MLKPHKILEVVSGHGNSPTENDFLLAKKDIEQNTTLLIIVHAILADGDSIIGPDRGVVCCLDGCASEDNPTEGSLPSKCTIASNTINDHYIEIAFVQVNSDGTPVLMEWRWRSEIPPKSFAFSYIYLEGGDAPPTYVNIGRSGDQLGEYGALSVATQNSPDGREDLENLPIKTAYNFIVGVSTNKDIVDLIDSPPDKEYALNLLFTNQINTTTTTTAPEEVAHLGVTEKITESPGFFTAWFKGDPSNAVSIIAVFGQDINYCTRTYITQFNCKKRAWSTPTYVEACDVNEYHDWQVNAAAGTAIKKVPCLNYANNCDTLPTPSPPEQDISEAFCDKCVWKFTKKYDCDKELWVCIGASVVCEGISGGVPEWTIEDCFAYITVYLDIPCKGAGDCPEPSCDQAPAGPFVRPENCCENPPPPTNGINTAICQPCVGDCEFLGCSVVGFNGAIGWNTQESNLNVDLVEVQCDIDGTGRPPQVFLGQNLIGFPVYFNCGGFFFGGLLQNWTYTSNSGGRTYNVKVIDPRQILEQATLIIDTYAGPPVRTLNYFNVYGFYEEQVYLNKDCSKFGTAEVTERGMPYNKIMEALRAMNPVVCTPTGANLFIDWSTFNVPVPEYFKIAGPSITILQLVADICNEAGYDFFVTLEPGDIIRIYPVSMKQYDPIEDNLFFGFNNVIDFSYGKELRITKTRNLLFGEQQHYLDIIYGDSTFNPTDEAKAQYVFNGVNGEKITLDKQDTLDPGNPGNFEFYFGEDPETKQPITPYQRKNGQFWVNVDIRKLNVTLIIPFPVDKMNICEYDIRTAMHSFDSFWSWTMHARTPSELGKAMQENWGAAYDPSSVLARLEKSAIALRNALADLASVANSDRANANMHSYPPVLEEIKKVHEWIAEFGRTYYGRQYLIKLKERVCIRPHPETYGEKMYTDTPTNDGGWVEPGIPVLGLPDPELEMFRTDDGRVGPLALFHVSGECFAYSGDGGGEYQYTLGSGIEVLPSGAGDDKASRIICTAPDGTTGCSDNPYHPDYVSGCVCEEVQE